VVHIATTKPSTTADEFTFTAPSVTNNTSLAKTDVEKINVFPNPYYGYSNSETSRQGHFVTFNHLPQKATIRIFDLAGVQVTRLQKDDPSQFITWNMTNQNNYPVASGIYVVYIDMPDLGQTKILKFAMIQEEQILNVY
ncbi:MAG TPA: T9SS type A sorting domain-containing protein, partial [Ignavibacteriaceae bacterium]|nr:T9SS type A sorting domain-containing protein [Ignavibacteriaceae bacterium]